MKWEYISTVSYGELSLFGKQGWEAYAVINDEYYHRVTYYLKRVIQ